MDRRIVAQLFDSIDALLARGKHDPAGGETGDENEEGESVDNQNLVILIAATNK